MATNNTKEMYIAVSQDTFGRYHCVSYGTRKSFDNASKNSRFFRRVGSVLEGLDLIDELKT